MFKVPDDWTEAMPRRASKTKMKKALEERCGIVFGATRQGSKVWGIGDDRASEEEKTR